MLEILIFLIPGCFGQMSHTSDKSVLKSHRYLSEWSLKMDKQCHVLVSCLL